MMYPAPWHPPHATPTPIDVRAKLSYDSRLIDLRPSYVLDERENTFGVRLHCGNKGLSRSASSGGIGRSLSSRDSTSAPSEEFLTRSLSVGEFLTTWTQVSGQTFGFKHARDAERPKSESWRDYVKQNYSQTLLEDISREKGEEARKLGENIARFPTTEGWKKNSYGTNGLPCRVRGGISTWLPSHTEVAWGAHKFNPSLEHYRVRNPNRGSL